MRRFFRGATLLMTLTTLAFLVRADYVASPWFDPGQFGDGKEHLVLVRIEAAKKSLDKGGTPREIAFKAKVLFDLTGALTDQKIRVTGSLNEFHGQMNAPDLAIGDTAVLDINPTKEANVFTCDHAAGLPIGLMSSVRIEPTDVQDVLDALKLAKERNKDLQKSHEDAIMFFESRNYYIWAFGAYMLATEGTKENASLLRSKEGDDECTMNHFYWINEMLNMPSMKDVAPTHEQRIYDYQNYLKRHTPKKLFGS